MDFCGVTDKGIVRKQNQDVFLTEYLSLLSASLLIVCDGMGGAKAGNVASRMALDLFREKLVARLDPFMSMRSASTVMRKALAEVNGEIYKKNLSDPACAGMGTTLVAALVTDSWTTVINVGDSRAYRISQNGIKQITKDHSVVEDLIDRGDISRYEALHHPNRHLITRALGTAPDIVPDIFHPELGDGEHLLLCSDGLTNQVGDQELLYEVLKTPDIHESCEQLIKLALIRGAPDNVTAVLLKK